MAAPSGSSQVQTVPCWQEIVQATVVLPVLLSQQAFLLLMFPVRARIGLPARGEQPAAFRVSPKLDAGTAAQVHQQSVCSRIFGCLSLAGGMGFSLIGEVDSRTD